VRDDAFSGGGWLIEKMTLVDQPGARVRVRVRVKNRRVQFDISFAVSDSTMGEDRQ